MCPLPSLQQYNTINHLLDITTMSGLSQQQATERLTSEGYNELPTSKPRKALAIAYDIVREPMFLLLIGGGIVYILLPVLC